MGDVRVLHTSIYCCNIGIIMPFTALSFIIFLSMFRKLSGFHLMMTMIRIHNNVS